MYEGIRILTDTIKEIFLAKNISDWESQWEEEKPVSYTHLQKENGGVSSARNLGLQEASGEYVTFVDADDWIGERMLEKLRACIERDKSELAICEFREVNSGDRKRLAWKQSGGKLSDNEEAEQGRKPAIYGGENTSCLLYTSRCV